MSEASVFTVAAATPTSRTPSKSGFMVEPIAPIRPMQSETAHVGESRRGDSGPPYYLIWRTVYVFDDPRHEARIFSFLEGMKRETGLRGSPLPSRV